MTYPAQRLWWEPQQRRPTREEIDAAGDAFRKAHGLDDDDDDDWSFDDEPAEPEIGRIMGVSRQVLHKRFRNHPAD